MVGLSKGDVVQDRFKVERELGVGSFGSVYEVREMRTGDALAMKTESNTQQIRLLTLEAKIMAIAKEKTAKHLVWLMTQRKLEDYCFVVMNLVGPSLQDLKRDCRIFSLASALRIGYQSLEALEELHGIGFLHRDIKPSNFAIGRREDDAHRNIFLLDFGFARRFCSSDRTPRKMRSKVGFRGSFRYATLDAQRLVDQGRKDDVGSWFYLLIEFTSGRLPWERCTEGEEIESVKEKAEKDGSLCERCPKKFEQIHAYLRGLKYEDEPLYDWIRDRIQAVMKDYGLEWERPYDWEKKDRGMLKEAGDAVLESEYVMDGESLQLQDFPRSDRTQTFGCGSVVRSELVADFNASSSLLP